MVNLSRDGSWPWLCVPSILNRRPFAPTSVGLSDGQTTRLMNEVWLGMNLSRTLYYGTDTIDGLVELFSGSSGRDERGSQNAQQEQASPEPRFRMMLESTRSVLGEIGISVVCRLVCSGKDKAKVENTIYQDYTCIANDLPLPDRESPPIFLPFRIMIPSGEPPTMSLPGCDISWEILLVYKGNEGQRQTLVGVREFQKACLYKHRDGLEPRACALRRKPGFAGGLRLNKDARSATLSLEQNVPGPRGCNRIRSEAPFRDAQSLSMDAMTASLCSPYPSACQQEMFIRASLSSDVYEMDKPVTVSLWLHLPCSGAAGSLFKVRRIKACLVQTANVSINNTPALSVGHVLDASLLPSPTACASSWTRTDDVFCKRFTLMPSGYESSINGDTFDASVLKASPLSNLYHRAGHRRQMMGDLVHGMCRQWQKSTASPSKGHTPPAMCSPGLSGETRPKPPLAPTIHKTTIKGRRGSTETMVISVRYHVDIRVCFYCRPDVKLVLPFTLSSCVDTTIAYDEPPLPTDVLLQQQTTTQLPGWSETLARRALIMTLYAQDAPVDHPPPYHRLEGESVSVPAPVSPGRSLNVRHSLADGAAGLLAYGTHSWFDQFSSSSPYLRRQQCFRTEPTADERYFNRLLAGH